MLVEGAPRARVILLEIWRPCAALLAWDIAVTAVYARFPFHAPPLPLALLGSALALFLGFRANSAYQRWWEGRVLWGAMINASRSLARMATNFLRGAGLDHGAIAATLVRRQIAYVHTLRHALRRETQNPEAERFLSAHDLAAAFGRANPANALLNMIGRDIDDARRAGLLDPLLQSRMEATLVEIANAQGGMERLKNTPLPVQYRFVPTLFAQLFCVLLPIGLVGSLGAATPLGSALAGVMFLAALRIGDDLVDPFANSAHDVPLTAMCRTIEIDLLEAIGEPAPAMLAPERGILW